MWWWREVRRAQINEKLREAFDELGYYVVTNCIGNNMPPAAGVAISLGLNDKQTKQAAVAWIREHIDREERHEQRLETVEWAILIFVGIEVLHDLPSIINWMVSIIPRS